ncbi:hypothetical protein ASPVEDRAFT_71361 [Aspergillus versicolor CBS 583.65]|uniref:Uncharacterized protein n=1 Tax=Aspergillus versicolor CBS 583.65 TaxID=1036611 RepID=A0A1L9PIA9_ASPVE|nr:uncharacterized protein ASPVEDRAFT_71361 [Aspergillus versicolor CBS 583.65]OJJ01259.1 hypothetical protein ASPVEDRAFT_71361 [Aspergillus versicolor CBS 583.65]
MAVMAAAASIILIAKPTMPLATPPISDNCSSQAPSTPPAPINPSMERINNKARPCAMVKQQTPTQYQIPPSFAQSFSALETRMAIFRSSSACSAAVGTIPIACSTCDDVQSPIDAHAITPIPNNARVLGDRDL